MTLKSHNVTKFNVCQGGRPQYLYWTINEAIKMAHHMVDEGTVRVSLRINGSVRPLFCYMCDGAVLKWRTINRQRITMVRTDYIDRTWASGD